MAGQERRTQITHGKGLAASVKPFFFEDKKVREAQWKEEF